VSSPCMLCSLFQMSWICATSLSWSKHMLLHTHTPTWPHVSLPRRYPVKLQASAHPSKQRFGHSTIDFGQAILPGMWDDVRLGTNLKACRRDPTCRFSNLCMDVGPGLLDLRVPLQDQKNS
jgi:hypothetical protein